MAKARSEEPRLKTLYREKAATALQKEFSYKSCMQIPRFEKIVVSMGVGDGVKDKKLVDSAVDELSILTGQKAVKNLAKKSIANFKLREGMAIGASVTLRGNQMFEFMDRLISIALPRVKDFRGVKTKSFDGHGNYSLGIKEQIIFPEIRYDKIARVAGMNIAFTTTAATDEECRFLLTQIGMPFSK